MLKAKIYQQRSTKIISLSSVNMFIWTHDSFSVDPIFMVPLLQNIFRNQSFVILRHSIWSCNICHSLIINENSYWIHITELVYINHFKGTFIRRNTDRYADRCDIRNNIICKHFICFLCWKLFISVLKCQKNWYF